MTDLTLFDAPTVPEPTGRQNRQVLRYLREHGAISRAEALNVLHCFNLPARILDLRKLGWPIISDEVPNQDGGTYVRYRLRKAATE